MHCMSANSLIYEIIWFCFYGNVFPLHCGTHIKCLDSISVFIMVDDALITVFRIKFSVNKLYFMDNETNKENQKENMKKLQLR